MNSIYTRFFRVFFFLTGTAMALTLSPSGNAGRTGVYFAQTGIAQYDYWVYVPASYRPENPAGILLFSHGKGAHGRNRGAQYRGYPWDSLICERYNVIGLNCDFGDGMDAQDQENKVRALQTIIAQTMADYSVIPGRGIICAFSNGGRPVKNYLHLLADSNTSLRCGSEYPFCHVALFSTVSIERKGEIPAAPAMAYTWIVGENEWPAAFIGTQNFLWYTGRMAGRNGNTAVSDTEFRLKLDGGHVMPDENDVRHVGATYHRAATFYAPFIRPDDFLEEFLQPVVEKAMALDMAGAEKMCRKLRASRRAESVPEKLLWLEALLARRNADVTALVATLAHSDPLLALEIIESCIRQQYAGHPFAEDLEKTAADIRQNTSILDAQKSLAAWTSGAGRFIDERYPRIRPDYFADVTRIAAACSVSDFYGSQIEPWVTVGPGRFAHVPEPAPAAVFYEKSLSVSPDDPAWAGVPYLPAYYTGQEISSVQLAWNENGLFGRMTVIPGPMKKTGTDIWKKDNLELFLEKSHLREFYRHGNAVQYVFAADDSQAGIGQFKTFGREPTAGAIDVRWSEHPDLSYLSFRISGDELLPAQMHEETTMGMHFAVTVNGATAEQFHFDKNFKSAFMIPYCWGAIVFKTR